MRFYSQLTVGLFSDQKTRGVHPQKVVFGKNKNQELANGFQCIEVVYVEGSS